VRYALSPYIKQIRFVFKGLIKYSIVHYSIMHYGFRQIHSNSFLVAYFKKMAFCMSQYTQVYGMTHLFIPQLINSAQ
jgi:hypothetical protein